MQNIFEHKKMLQNLNVFHVRLQSNHFNNYVQHTSLL